MTRIKNLDSISDKFVRRASSAGDEYKEGVSNAGPWKQPTQESEENWQAGIENAISNNSFRRGVDRVSDSDWKNAAVNKGGSNYSGGVRNSEQKYKKNFAPYHGVIANLNLPPRGPKGSPENYDRVRAVGEALHDRKSRGQ